MAFLSSSSLAAVYTGEGYDMDVDDWMEYMASEERPVVDSLSQSAPQLGRLSHRSGANGIPGIADLARLAGIPQSSTPRTAWGSLRKEGIAAPTVDTLSPFQETVDDDWGDEFELPDDSMDIIPEVANETPLSASLSSFMERSRPPPLTKRSSHSRDSLPSPDNVTPRSSTLSRCNSFKEHTPKGTTLQSNADSSLLTTPLLADFATLFDSQSSQSGSRGAAQNSAGPSASRPMKRTNSMKSDISLHSFTRSSSHSVLPLPGTLVNLDTAKRRSPRISTASAEDWSLDFADDGPLSSSINSDFTLGQKSLTKLPSSSSLKSALQVRKGILVRHNSVAESLSDAFESDSEVAPDKSCGTRERSDSSATLADAQGSHLSTIAELDESRHPVMLEHSAALHNHVVPLTGKDVIPSPTPSMHSTDISHLVPVQSLSRTIFPDTLDLSDSEANASVATGPLEVSYPRLDRSQLAGNLRRLLASPCPSLGTSVLGSDGDGDAGIEDDIEFPESLEVLLAGPVLSKTHRDNTHEAVAMGKNATSALEADDDEDPTNGLIIPDGKVLEIKVTAISPADFHKHMQGLTSEFGTENARQNQEPTTRPIAGGGPRERPASIPPSPPKSSIPVASRAVPGPSSMRTYSPAPPGVHTRQTNLSTFTPSRLTTSLLHTKRPIASQNAYGDGTELDGIEGFDISEIERKAPTPASLHKTLTPKLSVSGTLSGKKADVGRGKHIPTSPKQLQPFSLRPVPGKKPGQSKPAKKPTLIAQMGKNNGKMMAIQSSSTTMKWNPTLSKWEGNEEDLRDFDVPSPTRPALISNLGIPTSGTVSVGAMTFDPVKMRWVGNEREMDDAFGEFGDDDAASVMSIPIASRREFDIPPSLRDTLARAEDAHRAFMSRWYLKGATESFKGAQRPIPRNYMYDIYR